MLQTKHLLQDQLNLGHHYIYCLHCVWNMSEKNLLIKVLLILTFCNLHFQIHKPTEDILEFLIIFWLNKSDIPSKTYICFVKNALF